MKYTFRLAVMILCSCLVLALFARQINFTEDTSNFANPERGYAPSIDPSWPSAAPWDFCGTGNNFTAYNYTDWTPALDTNNLKLWRTQGMSVVMIRHHIAEFRSTKISSAFIARLDSDFAAARKYGFKLIFRFVYNWPKGGPDASLSNVLTHLGQLAPVLNRNMDALAFIDLGFIGCWGEMHGSSNDLVSGRDLNSATRAILDSAFNALSRERMIAVRYPVFKYEYFGNGSYAPTAPLTSSEAYSATTKARWGQFDDCLVCGEWNSGTWWSPRNNATEIRNFLASDNLYVVQSGEPGDPGTDEAITDEDHDSYVLGQHESCVRCLDIMETEHWSTINASYSANFDAAAYARWKKEGCYYTIAKKLGYRFRLISTTIPDTMVTGQTVSITLTMQNDGWARPYNPRKVEIIFRDSNRPSRIVHIPATTQETRLWLPGPGEQKTLTVSFSLADSLGKGTFSILLNLPDPQTSLYNNPHYSIRLANAGLWESSTGFNSLIHSVVVIARATHTQFTLENKNIFHSNEFQLVDFRGAHIESMSSKNCKGIYIARNILTKQVVIKLRGL